MAGHISSEGNPLWEGKFFRALSLPVSPMKHTYDIIIQRRHEGGWIDMPGGFNSLSDDYAYTNAREAAQMRERQCERPSPAEVNP